MSNLATLLKTRALLLGMLLSSRLWGVPPPGASAELGQLEAGLEPDAEPELGEEGGQASRRLGGRRLTARPAERIPSLVTSHELRYASRDARGVDRLYSGRVYLPTTWVRHRPPAVPLVVYVHATEAERDNIPQFNRGPEAMAGALAAYFHRFAVAMPDLPGYGHDPSPRPHPYCHAQSLALSILDMVRPALDLLEACQMPWDGRLFLVGYSSGAYGAMAAVKELGTNPRYAGLALTAAACMGGPFQFAEAIRASLGTDAPYPRPDIQAFLLQAYHDLYPEEGVFAQAINPALLETRSHGPDAGDLQAWLAGQCSNEMICQKIRARLTGSPFTPIPARAIMNPEWLARQILTPAWPDTAVGRILQENDLVEGWHPEAPMLLATSPRDECVSASNTYAIMEAWARRGCRAKVECHPLTLFGAPLDHEHGATLALGKAFRWFASGAYAAPGPAHRS